MKAVKHGVGRLYLIFQIEDNEKQTNGSQKAMYVWFIWLSYWSNHSGNSVGRLKFLAHLTLNIKQDSTPSTMISSVQFSHSVMSDCFQPYGLQHSRLHCPSPTPGVYSNSCPLSQWCHPIISSSVIPFFSFLQSFPASGSFPMSQFFTSGGKNIGFSFGDRKSVG